MRLCNIPRLLGTAAILAAMSCVLMPSQSQACDKHEYFRLSEEMRKLAARTAWGGVESKYAALLDTECDVSVEVYLLGVQSSEKLGKTLEMYERLKSASQIDPDQTLLDGLEQLDGNYGRVKIRGDARRPPELVREAMPFAPNHRKSIEWAMTVVTATGSFEGMIPVGDYIVGDITFSVISGPDQQLVEVKRKRGGGKATANLGESRAINYAHAVASLGPAFMMSPTLADPGTMDGREQFQPMGLFLGGIQIHVGGEVGLTFQSPEIGLAGTLGYAGTFGNSLNTLVAHGNFHNLQARLSLVLRPGNLRIAVGPTYHFIVGDGQGIENWFESDQINKTVFSGEDVQYVGQSWGGGAHFSAGYGIIDWDPLQGIISLDSTWQYDSDKHYFSFGLTFGIVPKVPRFEG